MQGQPNQVLIVGAGFSQYAGLPLQSEFTKALLAARQFGEGKPSRALMDYLCKFVHATFGHQEDAEVWPPMEDLFTCIDLSANTGHNLGAGYPAATLRTIRRALIARIIRMLRERYLKAQRRQKRRWKGITKLLKHADLNRTAFVSLNWDVATEGILSELHKGLSIEYGAEESQFDFNADATQTTSKRQPVADGPSVRIAKIHGSINWLYCDNCRRLYVVPPDQVLHVADQLLSESDWELIAQTGPPDGLRKPRRSCPWCPNVTLGTRIATFSYRKALDFSMFQRTWLMTERLLEQAARWVFIGYSLPAADYEFKYLLKRVQLARSGKVEIILVTGGSDAGVAATVDNYRRFFGEELRDENILTNGINDSVIERITGKKRMRMKVARMTRRVKRRTRINGSLRQLSRVKEGSGPSV